MEKTTRVKQSRSKYTGPGDRLNRVHQAQKPMPADSGFDSMLMTERDRMQGNQSRPGGGHPSGYRQPLSSGGRQAEEAQRRAQPGGISSRQPAGGVYRGQQPQAGGMYRSRQQESSDGQQMQAGGMYRSRQQESSDGQQMQAGGMYRSRQQEASGGQQTQHPGMNRRRQQEAQDRQSWAGRAEGRHSLAFTLSLIHI